MIDRRRVAVLALAAILVGVLVGYLWWGRPAQQALQQTRAELEASERRQGELRAVEERASAMDRDLKEAQGRIRTLEGDLLREREELARLQVIISQGKK